MSAGCIILRGGCIMRNRLIIESFDQLRPFGAFDLVIL